MRAPCLNAEVDLPCRFSSGYALFLGVQVKSSTRGEKVLLTAASTGIHDPFTEAGCRVYREGGGSERCRRRLQTAIERKSRSGGPSHNREPDHSCTSARHHTGTIVPSYPHFEKPQKRQTMQPLSCSTALPQSGHAPTRLSNTLGSLLTDSSAWPVCLYCR